MSELVRGARGPSLGWLPLGWQPMPRLDRRAWAAKVAARSGVPSTATWVYAECESSLVSRTPIGAVSLSRRCTWPKPSLALARRRPARTPGPRQRSLQMSSVGSCPVPRLSLRCSACNAPALVRAALTIYGMWTTNRAGVDSSGLVALPSSAVEATASTADSAVAQPQLAAVGSEAPGPPP